MPLTEHISLTITIILFLLYIGIDVFLYIQMPYQFIGIPQKGEQCPNQYIKYNQQNLFDCVPDCNQNTSIKQLINHHIFKKSNQLFFIQYENTICLPVEDKEFLKLEPYVQKPLSTYISQSLKEDLLLIPIIIFISISIMYLILYFYKAYALFITQNLNQLLLISYFLILLFLLAQITSIKEATEILNIENAIYEIPQMMAVFRLKALEFPYILYLGVIASLFVILAFNQFRFELDFSTFELSHWFTIKYYTEHINKKSQWPLVLLQTINFLILYSINMTTLAISEKSQQYVYGELSLIFNIVVPAVSLIIFIYFTLIFCILAEYNLFTHTNTSLSKIGRAGIQAFSLMSFSPLLVLNGFLQYFGNDKKIAQQFEINNLTCLKVAQELILNQQEHFDLHENSSFNETRPKLYFTLAKSLNRISLTVSFVLTAIMLLFQMYIPAATGICIFIYSISYIFLFAVVMSPLRYSFLPEQVGGGLQMIIGKEVKNIGCLLYIIRNQKN